MREDGIHKDKNASGRGLTTRSFESGAHTPAWHFHPYASSPYPSRPHASKSSREAVLARSQKMAPADFCVDRRHIPGRVEIRSLALLAVVVGVDVEAVRSD